MIEIELPFPPSVNHYYRHCLFPVKGAVAKLAGLLRSGMPLGKMLQAIMGLFRNAVLVSKKGREYRTAIERQLFLEHVKGFPAHCRLSIIVVTYQPDRRRRDLDNLWKCLLDSLKFACAFADDSQFDRKLIERGPVDTGGGFIKVRIEEYDGHGRLL